MYDEERSYYLPWIKHDLQPWKDGIEQASDQPDELWLRFISA